MDSDDEVDDDDEEEEINENEQDQIALQKRDRIAYSLWCILLHEKSKYRANSSFNMANLSTTCY